MSQLSCWYNFCKSTGDPMKPLWGKPTNSATHQSGGWSNAQLGRGQVRGIAPFFHSQHIHFSSGVGFNFLMKELFWKPYACQENKPSLHITPSSHWMWIMGLYLYVLMLPARKFSIASVWFTPSTMQKQTEGFLPLTKPLVAEGLHLLLLCKVVWRKKDTAADYYYYH